MPARPSAGAIAIYRRCLDWQAFEQAPPSDDWNKVRNAICTDSARKHQPRVDVYAYKREKALRQANPCPLPVIPAVTNAHVADASSAATKARRTRSAAAERSSTTNLAAVATDVNAVPMDIGSRLTRLERLLRSSMDVDHRQVECDHRREAVGYSIVRDHGFVLAGLTCTASHVEWEVERRSCGVVDCLLLWTNRSWSHAAVEHFDRLRAACTKVDTDDLNGMRQDDASHDEVRLWQRQYSGSTDVFLVVVDPHANNTRQQHRYRYVRHPHRSLPGTETEAPVVYIDMKQHAHLVTGRGLVDKLHELCSQADPALAPPQSGVDKQQLQPDMMVLDLTAVEPKRRRVPPPSRASSKRKSIDTPTDSTTLPEKRTRSGAEDGTSDDNSNSSNNSNQRLRRYRGALIEQLGLAQTAILPIVSNDARCALVAVLVALGKMDNGGDKRSATVASPVVVEQSRQGLARCLEQWTERMWVKDVPAYLRRRHWSGVESKHKQSSFRAYLDLLLRKQGGGGGGGGDACLDQCVLYLASIEYGVDVYIVTAHRQTNSDGGGAFSVTRIRAQRNCSRFIVLLRTRQDESYAVVQHHTTTLMTTEQHGELLHRLRQLPITAATSPAIADPEVDEPELGMGGYEKAPALLGTGSFARVYRVASNDPCAHPRWHAFKIASAANDNSGKDNQYEHAITMIRQEATALKKMAGHCGVPRLLQVVGSRALSMEYCLGGSLESAMDKASKNNIKNKQQRRLPVAVCLEVFRQLVCTIEHAHKKAGLLHRDIKPANILLRHKLTCTSTIHDVDVVLADWGLAIAASDRQGKGGTCGTPMYLPPEVLSKEQPFDTTCDMWAAGCVLAQMLRRGGAPLFTGEFVSDWEKQLTALLHVEIACDDVRKLLRAVLSPGRSERPDASKVLRKMLPSIVVHGE